MHTISIIFFNYDSEDVGIEKMTAKKDELRSNEIQSCFNDLPNFLSSLSLLQTNDCEMLRFKPITPLSSPLRTQIKLSVSPATSPSYDREAQEGLRRTGSHLLVNHSDCISTPTLPFHSQESEECCGKSFDSDKGSPTCSTPVFFLYEASSEINNMPDKHLCQEQSEDIIEISEELYQKKKILI